MTRLRIARLAPWLGSAAAGATTALAFPGWEIEPLVWIGPGLLLLSIWSAARRRNEQGRSAAVQGAMLGFVAGLCFFLLNLGWIRTVTIAGSFALPAYLALYWSAFGCFAATVGRPDSPRRDGAPFGTAAGNLRAAVLNAAAWTGLEWLRGYAFTGFGWNGLGIALWKNLTMIQAADVVGAIGLSFFVVFVASVGAGVFSRIVRGQGPGRVRLHADFVAAVVVILVLFGYGILRLREAPAGGTVPVRTLIVQPNIPQDEKWNPGAAAAIYARLADTTTPFLEAMELDLVVWPETALPRPLDSPGHAEFVHDVMSASRSGHSTALLFGVNEDAVTEGFYNSMVLVADDWDHRHVYRKIHLVPFGEYIPLREAFPPFEWVAGDIIPWDFDAGTSTDPIPWRHRSGTIIGIIPAICFEDTIGRQLRRFVREGPQIIVNVTNDGWFLRSPASRQHLANAVFRCIELRRPLIRSANTGISGVIDEYGSLHDRRSRGGPRRLIEDTESGSTFVEGSLTTEIHVSLSPPRTVYAKVGDLFAWLAGAAALVAILVAILIAAIRRPKRSGVEAEAEASSGTPPPKRPPDSGPSGP